MVKTNIRDDWNAS